MTQSEVPIFNFAGDSKGDFLGHVTVHRHAGGDLILESDLPLADGQKVMVLVDGAEIAARVAWSSRTIHGCTPLGEYGSEHNEGSDNLEANAETTAGGRIKARSAARRMAFAMHFAELRHSRGLTLADVADAVGVSKPTVWAWENGKALPIYDRLHQIAELVGVPVERLQKLVMKGDEALDPGGPKMPDDIVSECRRVIAEAFDLSPAAVRIVVDL